MIAKMLLNLHQNFATMVTHCVTFYSCVLRSLLHQSITLYTAAYRYNASMIMQASSKHQLMPISWLITEACLCMCVTLPSCVTV